MSQQGGRGKGVQVLGERKGTFLPAKKENASKKEGTTKRKIT